MPVPASGPIARALAGAALLCLLSGGGPALAQTGISPQLQAAARASTLEVVATKPVEDPLTYEKPLPLELLPFAIRSDPYVPIGTAFCIGRNRYVSAAHVLGAGIDSQYGPPKLRDRRGRVHEIDRMLKFSTLEDFAVFSLKDPPPTPPLAVNRAPQVNSKVYAVGDALGEGIVIRDGLFTSETPEELEGRWQWIRFSAAASPGNSGGPLLDERGRVIGVVLARSPNENLNYAGPIGRVLDAPEDHATVEARAAFSLSFMPDSVVSSFAEKFPLPASYAEFSSELLALIDRQYQRSKAQLLAAQADALFPKGAGSLALLYTQYRTRDPRLVMKQDGRWDAEELYLGSTVELPKNGSIDVGTIAGSRLLRLWVPDGVSVLDLFTDSRKFMDLALRGLKFTRSIGTDSIRITSLGAARSESEFVDAWQRKWQLRTWVLPFWDSVAISVALPVPGGCIAIVRVAPTALVYGTTDELKMLADLAYVTYQGTLASWREFLALKGWQPQAFTALDIAFEYDRFFRYRSPRLELELTPKLENISSRSVLALNFSWFLDHGTAVWDVAGLGLLEDGDAKTYVNVVRRARPPEALGRDFQDEWRKLSGRQAPYDGVAYHEESSTVIGTSVAAGAGPQQPIGAATGVLYAVTYAAGAPTDQKTMRSMQRTLLHGTRILEH